MAPRLCARSLRRDASHRRGNAAHRLDRRHAAAHQLVDLIVTQSLARRAEKRQLRAVDRHGRVGVSRDHRRHRRRGKHRAHRTAVVRCDIRSHQHYALAVDSLRAVHHLRDRLFRTTDDRDALASRRRGILCRRFEEQMHALRRAVAHHHADIFLIRERRKRARVVLLFTLVLAHGHSLHCTRAVGEEESEQRAHAIHAARILPEYALSLFIRGDELHLIGRPLRRHRCRADRLRRSARAHHARCVIGRIYARPLMDHVIHILSPCLSIQNR